MKAPDSLWVAAQWHPQEKKMGLYAFASAEETSHPDKEKFIRKNAILEWAKERKEQVGIGLSEYDAGHENGIYEVLNELINHIESL